jgi:hypothetical protein
MLTAEAAIEEQVSDALRIDAADRQSVRDEVSAPAGSNPQIAGYDACPNELPGDTFGDCQLGLREVSARIAGRQELDSQKGKLRLLYQAGPGASAAQDDEVSDDDELSGLMCYVEIE